MDSIFTVAKAPIVIDNNHESLYRSYHILRLVKQWLKDGVPAKTILQLVEEIEEENNNES